MRIVMGFGSIAGRKKKEKIRRKSRMTFTNPQEQYNVHEKAFTLFSFEIEYFTINKRGMILELNA